MEAAIELSSTFNQRGLDVSVSSQDMRSALSLDHAPSVRDTPSVRDAQSVVHAEYDHPLPSSTDNVSGSVLPNDAKTTGSGETQISFAHGRAPADHEGETLSEQRATSPSPPRAARVYTRKKTWQKSTGRLPGKDPLVLQFEHLKPYFGISQRQACMELGIGLSTMKRICRTFGIKRWPGATMYSGGESGNDAKRTVGPIAQQASEHQPAAAFSTDVDGSRSSMRSGDSVVRPFHPNGHARLPRELAICKASPPPSSQSCTHQPSKLQSSSSQNISHSAKPLPPDVAAIPLADSSQHPTHASGSMAMLPAGLASAVHPPEENTHACVAPHAALDSGRLTTPVSFGEGGLNHGHVPSNHGHVPSNHCHVPSNHNHVPSNHGHVPSNHGHVPSNHGHLPSPCSAIGECRVDDSTFCAPPPPRYHDRSQSHCPAAAPPCSGFGEERARTHPPLPSVFEFEPQQQQQQQQTPDPPHGYGHAAASVHALHTPSAYAQQQQQQQQQQGVVAFAKAGGFEQGCPDALAGGSNGIAIAREGSGTGAAFEQGGHRTFGAGSTSVHTSTTASSYKRGTDVPGITWPLPEAESAAAAPHYDERGGGMAVPEQGQRPPVSAERQQVLCFASKRGRVSVSNLCEPGALGGMEGGLLPQSPAGSGSFSKRVPPLDLPAAIQSLGLGQCNSSSSSSSSNSSGAGVGEGVECGRNEGEWLSTIDESWLQCNTNPPFSPSHAQASAAAGDVGKRERAPPPLRSDPVEWETYGVGRQVDGALPHGSVASCSMSSSSCNHLLDHHAPDQPICPPSNHPSTHPAHFSGVAAHFPPASSHAPYYQRASPVQYVCSSGHEQQQGMHSYSSPPHALNTTA